MEMATLVDQYYDKYIGRYSDIALPGHLKTLSTILRAAPLNQASCMSGVQTVITQNGAQSLAATGIAQNARTITPANGLIHSRKNYCRCRILWLRLPCHVN
jgi:hypothetical protein